MTIDEIVYAGDQSVHIVGTPIIDTFHMIDGELSMPTEWTRKIEIPEAWALNCMLRSAASRANQRNRARGTPDNVQVADIHRVWIDQQGKCNQCHLPMWLLGHASHPHGLGPFWDRPCLDRVAVEGGRGYHNNCQWLCYGCNMQKAMDVDAHRQLQRSDCHLANIENILVGGPLSEKNRLILEEFVDASTKKLNCNTCFQLLKAEDFYKSTSVRGRSYRCIECTITKQRPSRTGAEENLGNAISDLRWLRYYGHKLPEDIWDFLQKATKSYEKQTVSKFPQWGALKQKRLLLVTRCRVLLAE